MEYKIQKLVFPTEAKHQLCKKLFYRGSEGYLDREKEELHLGKGQMADFATYLNACSYRKWRRYTKAGKATLHLEVEGSFQLCMIGYTINATATERIERTEYQTEKYRVDKKGTICFTYPDNNDQMLGFEITAIDACVLHGGYYTVEIDEAGLNDVQLCLATTTCRKEAFIKKNVELLKKEIIEGEPQMRDNFFIHVVDNGRTLGADEIYGEHVYLHPNNNAGGSGGYARGMIEALHQAPKATHVLLMDDDVLVLPESIIRTFNLLKLLKEEYKDHFISGAMLYYEMPNQQHEDIGTVDKNGAYVTLKPHFDHDGLLSNLKNESDFVEQKNQYAAWWYCCIPTHVIEKNGLPLPLFIRWDDSEYSLRCKARFITMNGICIWHVGFATKYNAALDQYQHCRNFLIGRSCSTILQEVDPYDKILKIFRVEMLKFNYNGAELVLRAFEDYLKGPSFLKVDRGEEILKENAKLNEKYVPLDQILDGAIIDEFACWEDCPRKFVDKWLFRLTYNGQRFWPRAWCRKDPAYISFDSFYQPQKMAMHDRLIAINPFEKTGVARTLDKKRYKGLQKRFKKVSKFYFKHREQIEKAYRKAMPCLISERFWRKYLEI